MNRRGLIALVLVLLLAGIATVTYRSRTSVKVPAMDEVVSADFSVSGLRRPGDPVLQPQQLELLAASDSVSGVGGDVRSNQVTVHARP